MILVKYIFLPILAFIAFIAVSLGLCYLTMGAFLVVPVIAALGAECLVLYLIYYLIRYGGKRGQIVLVILFWGIVFALIFGFIHFVMGGAPFLG